MRELTLLEKTTLATLTKQIHQCFSEGYKQYYNAGQYLKQIRDKKLWEANFFSFKEYFEKTFGQHRSRAYQLIETYEIANEMPSEVSNMLDTSRQVNALKNVPKEQVAEVLKTAAKSGPITAKSIEQAKKSQTEKPAIETPSEVIPTDNTGYKIPKETLPFWEKRHEIQELLTSISKAKTRLEKARQEDDPIYRRISQAAIDHLSRAYQYVTDAKPYAVCLTCQGRNSSKCSVCRGTGLVCESMYAHKEAQEKRIIREKAYHLRPYA